MTAGAVSAHRKRRGLAVLLGWEVLNVPGMTSFHDTDYAGQGKATAAALDQYDLVFSHIEAPDEASHQADFKTKVESIEHVSDISALVRALGGAAAARIGATAVETR